MQGVKESGSEIPGKRDPALSKVQAIRSEADITFEAIEYDSSNSNAHLSPARGYR